MTEELYAVIAIGAVIALVALVWTSVHLGASIDHLVAPAKNPVVLDPRPCSEKDTVASGRHVRGRGRACRRRGSWHSSSPWSSRTTALGERWSMCWQDGCLATPRPFVAIPTRNTPRSPPRSVRGSRSDETW